MNHQPLVTPSPFAIAAPTLGNLSAPFQPKPQQQFSWGVSAAPAAAAPFGGASGGSSFGFAAAAANPFGAAAAASPFAPATAAAAAAEADGASPMAVQKETKVEHYTEGKIYLETWKHLQTAKKSGCWPFTSISAGPASEPVYEGLVFSNEQLRWEFMQRGQQEHQLFLQQLNEKLYNIQMTFYFKVKEKAAAERLPFEPDRQFESAAAFSFAAFPGAAAPAAAAPAAAAAAPLAFGSSLAVNPQAATSAPQPTFGAAAPSAATAATATPAAAAAAAGNGIEEAMRAFHSAAFEPGNIPDIPPPPEVC